VQARDAAGNESDVVSVSFVLDITAPTAEVSGAPASPTAETDATLTISGEGITHYQYKMATDGDYGAERPVATPIGLTGLPDGDFTVQVKGRDGAGNWQVSPTSRSWTVDTVAPAITGLSDDTTAAVSKTWLWDATDESSVGFRHIIDQNATWSPPAEAPYAAIKTVTKSDADGTWYLHVQARDDAGNESAVKTVSAVLDNAAPAEVTLSDPPASPTNDRTASFAVGGEGVSQYRYRLDTAGYGAVKPVGTPIDLTGLGHGLHRVYVIGADALGNWQSEASEISVSWTVDVEKPEVTGLSDGAAVVQSMSWAWGSNEAATFRHVLDQNETWSNPTGELTAETSAYLGSGNGTWYLHVQARDTAGNLSDVVTVYAVFDNLAPTAVISNIPETPTNQTGATLTVSGEGVAYYKYRREGTGHYTSELPVSTEIVLSNLADGPHTVYVLARDEPGNWQTVAATATWDVDTTPPAAAVTGQPPDLTKERTAALTVGGDDVTHYRYGLDGEPDSEETSVSTPISVSGLGDGRHTIEVIGRDTAGNWQAADAALSVSWDVDTQAPEITGVGDDDSPTREKTWCWDADDASEVSFRYAVDRHETWSSPSGAYSETKCFTKAVTDSSEDGNWYLHLQARDDAGNECEVKTVSVIFDSTEPVALISGMPGSPTKQTTTTLTIGGPGIVSYRYKRDTDEDYGTVASVSERVTLDGLPDGRHTVSAIAKDTAGNWQSESSATTVSWVVDTTAPVVTGLSDDTTAAKAKTWQWEADDAGSVTFRHVIDRNPATDDLAGITYSSVKTATKAEADGTWYLHVQALDDAGNESTVVTVSALLDNTPPVATVSEPPGSLTNRRSATFSVGGSGVSHYRYRLDSDSSSNEIPVAEAISLTSLGDGEHSLYVVGRDNVGNWQPTAYETRVVWTVDGANPTITGLSDDTTPRQSVTWEWGADETASFRFVIDQNSKWESPAGDFSDARSASKSGGDGTWYLHVQAQDLAGNVSSVRTVSAELDNTGPTAQHLNEPDDPSSQIVLVLNVGGDGVTHYIYYLDGGTYGKERAVSESIVVESLGDGPHTLYLLGRDDLGNWQSAATTVSWTVDTVPPEATVNGLPDSPTRTDSASLSIGGTGVEHYRYRLDDGSWGEETPVGESLEIAGLPDGPHTVQVRGKDAADNWQTAGLATTVSWEVDTTTPTVTGIANDSTPTRSKTWAWDADDASGVSFRYAVDRDAQWSGSFGAYSDVKTATKTVSESSEDGLWYLHLQARDDAGNESAVFTVSAELSSAAHVAEVSGVPTSPTQQTEATLTVGGEEITHYRYLVGDGSYGNTEIPIDTKIALTGLTDGSYTVSVIGKDSLGYWQSVDGPTRATWEVDTREPQIAGLADDTAPKTRKSWTWGADDSSAVTFRHLVDQNETWPSPSGIFTETHSASTGGVDGIWYLHVQATDSAGNQSDVLTVSPVLDNTPPAATVGGRPGDLTNQTGATLTIGGEDVTHYRFRRDTGDYSSEVPVSDAIELAGLGDGSHTVSVVGRDEAGNWQPTSAGTTVVWTVDATSPVSDAQPGGGVYGETQLVALSCDDASGSGCDETYYTVDGSEPTPLDTFAAAITIAEDTTIRFFSVDNAGNAEPVRSESYLLDSRGPDVSITTPGNGTWEEFLYYIEGAVSDNLSAITEMKLRVTYGEGKYFLTVDSRGGRLWDDGEPWITEDIIITEDRWRFHAQDEGFRDNVVYRITVYAEDSFGNHSEAESTFTYGAEGDASEITCVLSKDSIAFGEPLRVSGLISPLEESIATNVGINIAPSSGKSIPLVASANEEGVFVREISCTEIPRADSYMVSAKWYGDGTYAGATSSDVSLEVRKAESRVTLDGASYAVKLGEDIRLTGKFTPVPDCGRDLTGIPITITVEKPDETTEALPVQTINTFGHFVLEDHNQFDSLGVWKVRAGFEEDDSYLPDSSNEVLLHVVEDFGRVVLLGGGKAEQGNTYWGVTKKLSVEVYRDFMAKGFSEEMIYFMINSHIIDIDHDDIADDVVDGFYPTKETFAEAIKTEFASDLSPSIPLFIYMQGHATADRRFKVYDSENYITGAEIGDALDHLQGVGAYEGQGGLDCTAVLILEACYSGNFIADLSGPRRIILTSAGDEQYNTDATGHISFSRFLFSKLREGDNLRKAFNYARDQLVNMRYPSPRMDDNGDGAADSNDGVVAAGTFLNGNLTWGIRPVVENVVSVPDVEITNSAPFAARVIPGAAGMERVWVLVIAPTANITEGNRTITYPEIDLELNVASGNYEGFVDGLTQVGIYKLVVHAKGLDYEVSNPIVHEITVWGEVLSGDLNGDGSVTLADAVIALKVVSGIGEGTESIYLGADTNEDSRIGLPEVGFILQRTAGLR